FLYDLKAFSATSKAIEATRVGAGAIDFVRRTVVSLFRELLRLFCVLADIQSESGEVRCDRRLVRRAFVQALENIVKLSSLVLCAIKPRKRVERLTPHRRILCDTQPELFGFWFKLPFRRQMRESKFALRLFVCRLFGRAPKRFEFSICGVLCLPYRL